MNARDEAIESPIDRPLFELPRLATLLDSKAYRSFWASMHTLTYIKMQSGELYPRAQIEEIAATFFRGYADFFDALPDMVADKFGDPTLIDELLPRIDAYRGKLTRQVVAEIEAAAVEYGYGAQIAFVDEQGEPVEVMPRGLRTMDMHTNSPVVIPEDVERFTSLVNARVFANPFAVAVKVARVVLPPPDRSTIIETAAKHLRVSIPGGFSGAYDPTLTPYFADPMLDMTERSTEMVCFVGPAQTGKTAALVDAPIAHAIISEPVDMMIVQPSQSSANDYATRRLDRMIEASHELTDRAIPSPMLNRKFSAGQLISVAWPSINTLSGKSIPRMYLTDFDRMTLDLDGEGSPLGMAGARVRTFGSRGLVVVESSPGFEIDRDAPPVTDEHAAPTTPGILGAYNMGSLGRWYTVCLHCGDYFRFENEYLVYPKDIEPNEAGAKAVIACPHCGGIHTHDQKTLMNENGFWVHINDDAPIRSYWLQGVAARWSTWAGMVRNRLAAERHAEQSGDYTRLKTVINVDFGEPYRRPDDHSSLEVAADFRASASAEVVQREVPMGAGVVTTAVDIQKRRAVVQVHAWGMNGENWIIDRFNLAKSSRVQPDGSNYPIALMTHPEDWAQLDSLLTREYKNADGKIFRTSAIGIDSGGADTTTPNAYAYWRRARSLGFADKIFLLKGYSSRFQAKAPPPRVKQSAVDGAPGSRSSKAGAVPLWVLNTKQLKDEITAHIARREPGPNTLHLPDWIGDWFFNELAAEERTTSGWVKRNSRSNNEGFDLCVYNRAVYIILGGEAGKLNGAMPTPGWAGEIEIHQAPTTNATEKKSIFASLGARINK